MENEEVTPGVRHRSPLVRLVRSRNANPTGSPLGPRRDNDPRPGERVVTTGSEKEKRFEEIFLGYHVRERDGIFIAVPLNWSRGETIVSTDLATLRDEIIRWWYHVGK